MKTDAAERRTDEEPKRGGVSARVVYHAVVRHPVILLLVVTLAGAAAAGVWLFLPLPKKTAAVVYRVAAQPHGLLGPAAGHGDFNLFKQSQMALVKHRSTIRAALDTAKNPGVSDLEMIKSARPDVYAWLDKYLTVDSKHQSEYVRVTLEGDDEAELLALLKALDKAYLDASREQDVGVRNRRQAELQDRLADVRKELGSIQEKIDDIARSLGAKDELSLALIASDLRTELSQERRRVVTLEDDLEHAHGQVEAAGQAVAARKWALGVAGAWVDTLPRPDAPRSFVPQSVIDEELSHDPSFRELEAVAARARQTLALTEGRFQEGEAANQPSVLRVREAVTAAEDALERYRGEVVRRVRAKSQDRSDRVGESWLSAAQAERDKLQNQLARSKNRFNTVSKALDLHNQNKAALDALKKSIEVKEKMAATLAAEAEQMKVEGKPQPRVSQIDEPYIVLGIEGNRRLKFALLAAVGLLAAGFGGMVFWEVRSRRVTSPDEVAGGAGARLLGTIPPLAPGGASVGGEGHAHLVEAIDTARVMITHGTRVGHDLRVLLVTSAVAGEGKTTLSGHLAISLARAGFRTLLVDGDMHAPSAHSLFGVADSPGLCELLRGEAAAAAAVRPCPVPGLSVLPAGRWTVATRQALAGERWRTLAAELKAGFDFVVIDASPLLLVSDVLLLAREADGVVLSVLLGVSQIARVEETIERLRAVDAEVVGVVVNNVRTDVYRQYTSRIRPLSILGAGGEPARSPAAGAVES